MTSISITRALTELKTLDKRIQKNIDSGAFVSYQGQFHSPSPYVKEAKANYQSIMDLLERRKKLKSLIITSNAITKVTICGKEMTVAEAIETKSSIKHYKNLLARLKSQSADANRTVENINNKVRNDLEAKTSRNGSSTESKEKETQMDLVEFSKKYMEMHGVKLYDPLNISKKIESLEEYITNFENEIDYVLSEKNSVTFIDIE